LRSSRWPWSPLRRLYQATAGLFQETAGLRDATVKLWTAGERQLELIAKNSEQQSKDMQASTAVAEAANKLNRENFIAGQRPWIAIQSVELAGQFYCHGKSASVGLKIHIKNMGPSPAFIIFPFTVGYHAGQGTNMLNVYEEFADSVRKNTITWRTYGGVLYPGETRAIEGMDAVASWFSQQFATARAESKDDPKCLFPAIIVDIDYTSTHRTSHYQTAVVLELFQIDPENPNRLTGFNPDAGNVEQKDLRLILHPAGHYAD
jgi:hypothetical protein